MSIVAIIPARGGSKGIPGKNLRTVAGIPLVVRAVSAARSCGLIDRVIVTTDDAAIADAALAADAEVVTRPPHLAGDRATSESAVLHALDGLEHSPEIVVFVQPTSPFIDTAALCEAIERVRSGVEDVVFSAVEDMGFLWRVDDGGSAAGINHDASHRPRRQDREPQFRETGAFYVMRGAGFLRARYRFFGRVGVAIVEERTGIEIDTLDELALANAIAPLVDPTPLHSSTPSPLLRSQLENS
jgi:N-acylneuraminate cytidylyltransferase